MNKEISDLRDAKELPALRKKYDGKWFKKEHADGLTIYSKVLELVGRENCTAFRLTSYLDSVSIGIEEWTPLHLLGKSIPESEFKRALDMIRNRIDAWQLK